jgi:hypothetical protein
MTRPRWAELAAAAALLLSCANSGKHTVPVLEIDLAFAPLPVEDAERIKAIRLVADSGRTALAMLGQSADGTPELSIAPLDGPGPGRSRPLFTLDSPFGLPSWDVAGTPTGIAAVWTKPGSAISPLGYRGQSGGAIVLTGRYPSGVFQSPRFVRGAEPGEAVTAIAYERSGKVVALFQESIESGRAAYTPLPSAGAGIPLDGLLLRDGAGYVLFVKLLAPGPRGPERTDRRGESLQPGLLYSLRLDATLQPVGASARPIGDTALFEFDADAAGGRLFLLATTQTGYTAAVATASEGSLRWTASDVAARAELVAPSVLAAGQTTLAAVIESAATQRPRILTGRY